MGQQGVQAGEAGLFRGVPALPSTLSVLFGKLLPLPDLFPHLCIKESYKIDSQSCIHSDIVYVFSVPLKRLLGLNLTSVSISCH